MPVVYQFRIHSSDSTLNWEIPLRNEIQFLLLIELFGAHKKCNSSINATITLTNWSRDSLTAVIHCELELFVRVFYECGLRKWYFADALQWSNLLLSDLIFKTLIVRLVVSRTSFDPELCLKSWVILVQSVSLLKITYWATIKESFDFCWLISVKGLIRGQPSSKKYSAKVIQIHINLSRKICRAKN